MLSHIRMGVPMCSITALRHFSHYSMLKSRLNAGIVFKRLMVSGPTKLSSVTPNRILHQIYDNSYSTVSSGYEDATSSDSESDSEKSRNEDALNLIFETKTTLSENEWTDVIDQLAQDRKFSIAKSFDGIIMKLCLRHSNYQLADSYLQYLQTQSLEPNLLALGFYLQLCGRKVEECGEDKILDVYQLLTSKVKTFDVTLSEHAILALTKTSKWKQAFKHLPVIKKLCSINAKVYNAIITAAFKNGDYDTGWQLLDTMFKEEKEPFNDIFLEWIKQCELAEDKEAMVNILVQKLGLYEMYPSVPVIKEMRKFYEDNMGWSGAYVKIFNRGKCPGCNRQLETTDVDEEAFAKLQEEFVSRVLLGSDIFKTTSPEEWSKFCTFVKEEGPFTTVVDGLNVAYTVGRKPPEVRMRRLREAVMKIKVSNRKNRIMVIGRKHMEMWSPRDLEAIKRRAKVFTLDNISKDDGFFIYVALQSGIGAQFVTSDMLRDHIYRLGDPSLRETFRHWQRKHQVLAISSPSGVYLVPPPDFRTAAQNHGADSWHIPYNDGTTRESYQVPHTWLCLQSKPHEQENLISSKYVREIPFECSYEETKNLRYLNNPKNFGIEPGTSGDFITLTGELLGAKSSNSKSLDIEYGKFKGNHQYSKAYAKDSKPMFSRSSKSMETRNKMKEDMKKIISNNKTKYRKTSLPTSNFKGIPNKQQSKASDKIVIKDIFTKT